MSIANIIFVGHQILLVQSTTTKASDEEFKTFMEEIREVWQKTQANEDCFVFILDLRNFEPSAVQIISFAGLFIEMKAISDSIIVCTYLIINEKYRTYLDVFLAMYTPQKPVSYAGSLDDALKSAQEVYGLTPSIN